MSALCRSPVDDKIFQSKMINLGYFDCLKHAFDFFS